EEGMRRAAYAADTDPGNDKVGPSNLPHLAHLSAGLMMAIEQSINSGLLPADPGQTWDKDPPVELVVADSVETRGAKPGVMIEYDVLLSTSGDCSRETAEPNTGWNPVREIIKSR
ncbi:MAG: hypothetical protein GY813_20115, partial [Halieaceae bacterium]|nr:hypothetical protein [Halieaceae bacterium]